MAGQSKKKLRSGFTTGTAATAAVKGALIHLITGKTPEAVDVQLLIDKKLRIAIQKGCTVNADTIRCTVVKDGGDDPDITHKAVIGAEVRIDWNAQTNAIRIRGGKGVGTVTKPGLEILPGKSAITCGPLKMIRMAVSEVRKSHNTKAAVDIEVFVPSGETLARKTLNGRLGILGGISILGTTGVVKPLSHASYIATIDASLSVARAAGLQHVVLTTGRRSERYAQDLWPDIPQEGFIQMGDFFKKTMKTAAGYKFRQVAIAIFFGKAVKMAQGIGHTHARSARLTLEQLAQWALELTGRISLKKKIQRANTARHVYDFIKDDYPAIISRVGHEIVDVAHNFSNRKVSVRVVIFDFDGTPCFDSAARLLPPKEMGDPI